MNFRVLNKKPLYDYREACKITQGIKLDSENTIFIPKNEFLFWVKQIIANHSTLRCIHFVLVDSRPKSVVMQLIRATKGHPQPEVQSSRPDWNDGKERSSDPYEDKLFLQVHTAESFIEMAKQRLCNRTEERTRMAMKEMVEALKISDELFLKAVGYCCHPVCWWYKGCPEIKSCGSHPHKVVDDVMAEYIKKTTSVKPVCGKCSLCRTDDMGNGNSYCIMKDLYTPVELDHKCDERDVQGNEYFVPANGGRK